MSSTVISRRLMVLVKTNTIGSIRTFSHFTPLHNEESIRPSKPEMKSDKAWINNSSNSSSTSEITKQVIGMTKSIQETNQPPLNINPMYTRNFEFGQIYEPFDFSNLKHDIEKRHVQKSIKSLRDPFEKSGIDPSTLYIYPEILSKYLSSTGQILPRSLTGCNATNQKKLANAIKTARCCGLLASTNRHNITLPSRIL
ncbi:hypothetical protein DFJ63DRAFT_334781 [Scheffersomyces coipomensis]|uniref:uncharacterized protein n=1 Tax=Scheffersomyces coipomensis TaxID=1788519 RepID=UPI00315C541F